MRILSILLIAGLLSSCKQEVIMQDSNLGHWVNKDYLKELKANRSPKDVSVPLLELFFEKNDSNYVFYFIGRDSYTGKYIPNEEGKLIATSFARSGQDYEFNFTDTALSLYNLVTHETMEFVKIREEELKQTKNNRKYKSFAIPYINNLLIAGNYTLGDSSITFTEEGYILGLDRFQTYSLCLTRDCLNASGSNVMYLANKRNEGLYYDVEFINDSLIIYNINEQDFLFNAKASRKERLYALKKIN